MKDVLVAAAVLVAVFVALVWLDSSAVTILIVLAACYMLPTIVAAVRGHHNILAVSMLNLFLGWTFVGWVISLVWACMATQRKLHP